MKRLAEWMLPVLATLVVATLGAGSNVVQAGEAASGVSADDFAQFQAMLEAQQRRISELEQRLASAEQSDVNKARIETMREQIREILKDQEFRDSLMPPTLQAGYDKGFFIRSSDEKFQIKFNAMMQFRWTYYHSRRENRYQAPGFRRADRSGFDIARLRMRFGGHLFTKDLTYLVELDASSPSGYDARLYYAWVNYRFIDELQFKAGQFRIASTRADFGSTNLLQFVDWPMMNAVYGLGNGTGVRLWGQLFKKRVEYYLDVVNSLNNPATQTITNDEDLYNLGHDSNPAIVARLVWHALVGECDVPLGVDQHFDSLSDIEHHTKPALDVGMHYAFTEDWHDGTLRIPFNRRSFRPGGFGLTSSDGLQINQIGFDAAFKWMGFSITGEYVIRLLDVRDGVDPPWTPLYQLTTDGSTNAQQGGYVQAGYFLPIPGLEKKLELVARIGGVSALAGGQEGAWEYAGGVNYYIQGHRVKLQMDVTKVTEAPISSATYSLANVNDDALIWRVQLQVAF
jgi:hypothetical protein